MWLIYIFAVTLLLPPLGYSVENAVTILRLWPKYTWADRPFMYIGVTGILAFVIYQAALSSMLFWTGRVLRDRFLITCAITAASLLAFFWVGLLTWSIAVG